MSIVHIRATDRATLRAWLTSQEGQIFQAFLTEKLEENRVKTNRNDFHLFDPKCLHEAVKCQGEARLIQEILDENKLLDRLEKLAEELMK